MRDNLTLAYRCVHARRNVTLMGAAILDWWPLSHESTPGVVSAHSPLQFRSDKGGQR